MSLPSREISIDWIGARGDSIVRSGLPVLTVPTVDELREGKSRIERLRLAIEQNEPIARGMRADRRLHRCAR